MVHGIIADKNCNLISHFSSLSIFSFLFYLNDCNYFTLIIILKKGKEMFLFSFFLINTLFDHQSYLYTNNRRNVKFPLISSDFIHRIELIKNALINYYRKKNKKKKPNKRTNKVFSPDWNQCRATNRLFIRLFACHVDVINRNELE